MFYKFASASLYKHKFYSKVTSVVQNNPSIHSTLADRHDHIELDNTSDLIEYLYCTIRL